MGMLTQESSWDKNVDVKLGVGLATALARTLGLSLLLLAFSLRQQVGRRQETVTRGLGCAILRSTGLGSPLRQG